MLALPEYHKPDRNEPDSRVKPDTICLTYGFKGELEHLNGKECLVFERVYRVGNEFLPVDEFWFECFLSGYPLAINIRSDHLTLLNDMDALAVELYMKKA